MYNKKRITPFGRKGMRISNLQKKILLTLLKSKALKAKNGISLDEITRTITGQKNTMLESWYRSMYNLKKKGCVEFEKRKYHSYVYARYWFNMWYLTEKGMSIAQETREELKKQVDEFLHLIR